MRRSPLQEFGEDAMALLPLGWKLLNPNIVSSGVYRTFKKAGFKVWIVILPSQGYPLAPPIVVFLAENPEFFTRGLSHPCLWDDPTYFERYLPEWLRGMLWDKSYIKKVLHIEEKSWKTLADNKNRLYSIHNFLVQTLGMTPL